jgi:hypothetical protein
VEGIRDRMKSPWLWVDKCKNVVHTHWWTRESKRGNGCKSEPFLQKIIITALLPLITPQMTCVSLFVTLFPSRE